MSTVIMGKLGIMVKEEFLIEVGYFHIKIYLVNQPGCQAQLVGKLGVPLQLSSQLGLLAQTEGILACLQAKKGGYFFTS